MTSMRCERVQRWFSRARDGELSRRQRRQLAAHLRACAGCRQEYRRFRRSCRWLRVADPARGVEMPTGLADAVVARVRAEQEAEAETARALRRPTWVDARLALGIAATLALLLWGDRWHVLDEPVGGAARTQTESHRMGAR